jgi:cyclic pyranopterin phosphate synthase
MDINDQERVLSGYEKTALIDRYKRKINYLRISVTDRCNLRCIYCIPPDGITKVRHEDILTYEETLRLARIAVGLGVDKIRLTGGEPLLRKGIYEFITALADIPGLEDLALTTNGILLGDDPDRIASSGVKRLNISLDTLDPKKYEMITGLDAFKTVWEGIRLVRELNLNPIKINVVVMKGINDDELTDFARLSLENPYHIRFIEYMPLGIAHREPHVRHVPSHVIKSWIGSLGRLKRIQNGPSDGPAERFRFEGACGEIGFISPLTNHFCGSCNRIRLTATGRLRPCLLSDTEHDIKGPMRNGASDKDLTEIIMRAVYNKPRAHHLASVDSVPISAIMSSIGG